MGVLVPQFKGEPLGGYITTVSDARLVQHHTCDYLPSHRASLLWTSTKLYCLVTKHMSVNNLLRVAVHKCSSMEWNLPYVACKSTAL